MSRRNTLGKKGGKARHEPERRGRRAKAEREPQSSAVPHTDRQVARLRTNEPGAAYHPHRFPSPPLEVRDGPPPPGPEQRREQALRALIECGSRMAKETRDPDWDYLLHRAREIGVVPWT